MINIRGRRHRSNTYRHSVSDSNVHRHSFRIFDPYKHYYKHNHTYDYDYEHIHWSADHTCLLLLFSCLPSKPKRWLLFHRPSLWPALMWSSSRLNGFNNLNQHRRNRYYNSCS